MPRPKPSAPLRPRQLRLDDETWDVFQKLGGVTWLREYTADVRSRVLESKANRTPAARTV